MFTGLVDDIGVIEQVGATEAGREFRVRCRHHDLLDGESIALDGVCLTVRTQGAGWFTCAAVVTTLDRTGIGAWDAGRRVNLERAMRPTDRLGGHIVQGHVDAVGRITSIVKRDDAWIILVAVPPDVEALLVAHGSVCVDGISLTVNELPGNGLLGLSIIEYTWRHTTLSDRAVGDTVHVECDVIGKFVQHLLSPYLRTLSLPSGDTSPPHALGSALGLFRSMGS
ncbi:MAG TPA: riboflavin synthase [Gemmatimonadaceae bacterium]|nr:riboflavin synthase [Gemmatimonadaceae bacterium]